jgi:hypothetical protein
MAGLDPAINVLPIAQKDVDARVKSAHDDGEISRWPILRTQRSLSVITGRP